MKKLQIKQHPENLVRRLEILVETDKVRLSLFNILKDALTDEFSSKEV